METLSILTPGTSVPPRNALTDEDFLIRFFMPSAERPEWGVKQRVSTSLITLWALDYGHGR